MIFFENYFPIKKFITNVHKIPLPIVHDQIVKKNHKKKIQRKKTFHRRRSFYIFKKKKKDTATMMNNEPNRKNRILRTTSEASQTVRYVQSYPR